MVERQKKPTDEQRTLADCAPDKILLSKQAMHLQVDYNKINRERSI